MRLVGGILCGRRLLPLPTGTAIRPTADHVREAIFNVLTHRFQNTGWHLSGAHVVDACAGTGAMGLEALSRGADHVTFIDSTPVARSVILANVCALGLKAKTRILTQDILRPSLAGIPCTLAFVDPPYTINIASAALTALQEAGWLAGGALCVVEHLASQIFEQPAGFHSAARTRIYRRVAVLYLWAP